MAVASSLQSYAKHLFEDWLSFGNPELGGTLLIDVFSFAEKRLNLLPPKRSLVGGPS